MHMFLSSAPLQKLAAAVFSELAAETSRLTHAGIPPDEIVADLSAFVEERVGQMVQEGESSMGDYVPRTPFDCCIGDPHRN